MKTIGLIGGSTWLSTIDYYKHIITFVGEKLGGHHSAKILLYSFNFNFLREHSLAGEWDIITERIIKESKRLIQSGADCMVLCANTLHFVADEIQKNISVPLIHIADAVGVELQKQGHQKAGLLGTKFTMENDFYPAHLKTYGIETLTPEAADRQSLHEMIFNELALNKFTDDSKKEVLDIIRKMNAEGATAVILGCTELPLLISQDQTKVQLLDTTLLHSRAAVNWVFMKE